MASLQKAWGSSPRKPLLLGESAALQHETPLLYFFSQKFQNITAPLSALNLSGVGCLAPTLGRVWDPWCRRPQLFERSEFGKNFQHLDYPSLSHPVHIFSFHIHIYFNLLTNEASWVRTMDVYGVWATTFNGHLQAIALDISLNLWFQSSAWYV